MLKLWQPATLDTHRDLFLERHNHILAWALKLTRNRRDQADDLVQDTFVYLVNTRPDLSRVRDLDAYLYVLVRNLHRAQIQKALSRATLNLTILEFDSACTGLKSFQGQGDEERLHVQNELRRICSFALRRQEASRSGSVLILRFFHGYYPREIAAILRCSRGVIDEHLRQARKECRAWLDTQRGLSIVSSSTKYAVHPDLVSNELLLAELRETVFAQPIGSCPSLWTLHEIYRKCLAKPEQPVIAHIVSCARCLDAVNDFLGLARLSTRDPNDTTGYGASGGGRSKPRRPSEKQTSQWERHAAEIREHYPDKLRIAVNSQPLVTHVLNSEETDFTITVPVRDQVDFVEVLSEQDVCLGMLVVAEPPPDGAMAHFAEITLSDDRTLLIDVSFDSPWPTVHVTYRDPHWRSEPIGALDAGLPREGPAPVDKHSPILEWLQWWLNARRIAPAIAVLTIFAVLFVQTRQTEASAATFVARAEEWQRKAVAPGVVLHRTFDLIERPKRSSLANHKRVEVWRKPGDNAKYSRLFDQSGKLLSSARIVATPATVTSTNAWQFDPSPDTFRRLAGDLNRAHVEARTEKRLSQLDLVSDKVRLKLNALTFAPTGEIIQTGDAEFEFREIATEPVPESASPFAAPAAVLRGTPSIKPVFAPTPLDRIPSEADLEESEVLARVALHSLKADMGEEIELRQHRAAVEVAGVVDSLDRKEQLTKGLVSLPHLRVSLLSPEDLSSVTNDRIATGLTTPPDPRRAMHPPLLESWLETEYANETDRRAYASRVVELARDCARRGAAIREIARRYGQPGDARLLAILSDHWNAIRRDSAALNADLTPALNIDADIRKFSSWREAADGLFDSARTLESTALVLLTTTNAEGSDAATNRRACKQAQVNIESALSRLVRKN